MILDLVMLDDFISANREEIIVRRRAKVARRSIPPPTNAEIDHGVPVFLGQLVKALHSGSRANSDIADSALHHGHDLLMQGFTVSQVVHDYGDVCQSITALAVEMNVPISIEDFRTLNQCLDDAIAGAVTEYGRARTQSTLDGEVARQQSPAERVQIHPAAIDRDAARRCGAERVLIEVLDACNGLPSSKVGDLFRPFEQRGADRTGAGLGLAFSRWGADVHNGRIYARNLPKHVCVFTLDLPRAAAPPFSLNSH